MREQENETNEKRTECIEMEWKKILIPIIFIVLYFMHGKYCWPNRVHSGLPVFAFAFTRRIPFCWKNGLDRNEEKCTAHKCIAYKYPVLASSKVSEWKRTES